MPRSGLALGAEAVPVGRPYLYGLAAAGEKGVRQVIRTHTTDVDRSVIELDPTSLSTEAGR